MYAQVEKTKENKGRAVANSVAQKKSNVKHDFVDNRTTNTALQLLSRYQQKIGPEIRSNKPTHLCNQGDANISIKENFTETEENLIQRVWNKDGDVWTWNVEDEEDAYFEIEGEEQQEQQEENFTYNQGTGVWNWFDYGDGNLDSRHRFIEELQAVMSVEERTKLFNRLNINTNWEDRTDVGYGAINSLELEGLMPILSVMNEEVAGGELANSFVGSMGAGPCIIVLIRTTLDDGRMYGASLHLAAGYDDLDTSAEVLTYLWDEAVNFPEAEAGIQKIEWYFIGGEVQNIEDRAPTENYLPFLLAAQNLGLNVVGSDLARGNGDTTVDAYLTEQSVYFGVVQNQ